MLLDSVISTNAENTTGLPPVIAAIGRRRFTPGAGPPAMGNASARPPEWSNFSARTLTSMATISKGARRRLAAADRIRQGQLRVQRAAEQRVRADQDAITHHITAAGWAVAVTENIDPSGTARSCFAYTIGRTEAGQPELCAWGQDGVALQAVLNTIGAILMKKGHRIEAGDVVNVPPYGIFRAAAVSGKELGRLEYARSRYAFLRAVRVEQIG
jgi:hypothetical protein